MAAERRQGRDLSQAAGPLGSRPVVRYVGAPPGLGRYNLRAPRILVSRTKRGYGVLCQREWRWRKRARGARVIAGRHAGTERTCPMSKRITLTPETTEALLDERHSELCGRPDMDHHGRGCEEPECVDRCERGYCRCAGCEAHLSDWMATADHEDLARLAKRAGVSLEALA